MDRWHGKVALVTGAASGIGRSIARKLLSAGVSVVGLDVQFDRLKRDAEDYVNSGEKFPGTLHPLRCDVSRDEDLTRAFRWVEENLGGADILVNNAGITNYVPVIESDRATFEQMVNVDFLAVATTISLAVKSMKARGVEGHIFNVNSILGHVIPENGLTKETGANGWNLYPACKHAAVALTHTVRRELKEAQLPIRITSISPGLVNTEISKNVKALNDFNNEVPALDPDDVADALCYALSLKPHVQVAELSIQRTGEIP